MQFTATPSTTLVGEEKRLCEEVINGQSYELEVHLGGVIFEKRGLIYNKDHEINEELSCSGNISKCAHANIKGV